MNKNNPNYSLYRKLKNITWKYRGKKIPAPELLPFFSSAQWLVFYTKDHIGITIKIEGVIPLLKSKKQTLYIREKLIPYWTVIEKT